MPFDRYGSWFGQSWAKVKFRKYHTEIGDLYWTFAPLESWGSFKVRRAISGSTPQILFRASGPDARRLPPSLEVWKHTSKELSNWVRLSCLMSSVSYFEIYLRMALTASIMSDPLSRFGQSRLVDGLVWLKRGAKDDHSQIVKACVQGSWDSRLSNIEANFGKTPDFLKENQEILENIQRIRNDVGHSFGRRIFEVSDPLDLDLGMQSRIKADTFIKYMEFLFVCVEEVDQYLLSNHIGEFELLLLYHRWLGTPSRRGVNMYNEKRRFSQVIGDRLGRTPGLDFIGDVIDFYRSVR